MIQLQNDQGLIGDSVNTVPVMIALSEKYNGLNVAAHPEAFWLYDLIPKKYNITRVDKLNTEETILELDIHDAFAFALEHGVHMTQAYQHQFDLRTPEKAIVPDLDIPDIEVPVYDYVFAPFGRSAGTDERWPMCNWVELAYEIYKVGKTVCILGNSKHDHGFNAYRTVNEYDRPIVEVLNIIKKANKGCISIITGISHLCYAVGCKNYLFSAQGSGEGNWGVNPKALCMETYIPKITVEEALEFILNN